MDRRFSEQGLISQRRCKSRLFSDGIVNDGCEGVLIQKTNTFTILADGVKTLSHCRIERLMSRVLLVAGM